MKKDAYYFPHYSNARNDVKLLKLRRVLGLEGYGIYFCLLEILRDQTDFRYPLSGLSELEFELRVPKEKISSVVMDYGLFEVDSTGFFSPKLVQYLMPYIEKTERARFAAQKRWSDANAHANALHLDMQGEERIGEESKKENIKPSSDARKKDFYNSLLPYVNEFTPKTVRDFYEYWIEESKSGKLRFESEKFWDVKRRLSTWKRNEQKLDSRKKGSGRDKDGLVQ